MLRKMFTIVCTGSVFSVHAMVHTWERKFSLLLGRCTIGNDRNAGGDHKAFHHVIRESNAEDAINL